MRKLMKRIVSLLCLICVLVGCLPVRTYATDGTGNTSNEIIIKSTDTGVVTHTPNSTSFWKSPTPWSSLKGQIGTEYVQGIQGLYEDSDTIPRTSTKAATATYNLSGYSGTYQLYYLNLNQGTGAMTVTATITNVDNEVSTITYDPTNEENGNGEWLDFGTHKLGTTSSLVLSKPADSSGNFRDAAIKLVPVTEESNPTASPVPTATPTAEPTATPTAEPTASPTPTESPTTNDIIIKASDTEKITFGDPSSWTETEWSQVKPTDTGYLTGVEGIFADTDITYKISKNNNIKFDLTAYSGGTYKLYYLNLTTGTEANADGSDTARFSFRYDGTKASAINIDYKPLKYGNGEWILIDTYEIGSASIIYIQNNKSLTNFRAAALKLVPVAEGQEPSTSPEPTASPEAPDNSIIISCTDARVSHNGSWRDVAVTSIQGPTGEGTKRTSSVYSNAVYNLSGFGGTYDIYFYNLNSSSSNTEAKVSITKADGEVVHGIFDPTQKADATWISMGTFELGEESAFVLTNIGSNGKNLRNAAIKLVPNTSGTAITADVTLAPYTPVWRTINDENPIILLSAVDDGTTMSYGWKPSSVKYPTGTGFYTGVSAVGEWAQFMPYLNVAQDITLWYFVSGNANGGEDPALLVEIYAEGQLTTKTIDFTTGENRWEELGTFDFDGSGNEYIKFTKTTSDTTTRLTNLRLGYKSAVKDEEEAEIYSVYKDTDKEILQRIGLLTGTVDGITEEYIRSTVTQTDLEVIRLKMNGQFEAAKNYVGSSAAVSAKDYAKMLLEQMGYVYGTDFNAENMVAFAAEKGVAIETEDTFTIDALADMTVQALEANMKGEKRSLLGSVMDKIEPISEEKYTNPSVFTDEMREERETAKNRDRTLIYNNDGNDTYVGYANYPGPFDTSTVTEPMTHENFLSKRTIGLETSQVDSIFYGTGVYNSYHHNSAIADLRQRDWSPELFKTGEVKADGTVDKRDSIHTVLDWCKENNREFMWSMRMNDTHDAAYEVKYLDSFKQAHPDWLVSSRETAAIDLKLASAPWSALDYAQQGVRQRSYDLLREVIINYDVDGIELDFSRHAVYFKQVVTQAEDADPENVERINNFMRSLRTLTEQVSAEKGEPILIAIHVADSMDFCKAIGLDVKQWMEEDLVDVVSIRTYGAYQYMEDGLAEYEGYDVPVYLIMDANNRESNYNYSKEAALAYKAGYTGIQIYNVFDPTSDLFWTLGDESTVTYDASYTEKTRIPTDTAFAINAKERFVTYRKETQSISFVESSVSKVFGDADFTITVNGAVEGSTVTYSSSNTKVATVDATIGKVTICGAGEAVITATASSTKTHAGATATYTLTVEEAPPAPTPTPLEILTDGTAESYQLNSNAVIAIHCSGELAELESVKMDGTVVDASNYDLTEGSTIVTFKNAYLDSLSEGEHTVTLCYSDNRSIDSKLTIKAADTPKVEEDDDDDDDTGYVEDTADDNASAADTASGSVATSATPTGDYNNIGLWILLLATAMAVYGALLTVNKKR